MIKNNMTEDLKENKKTIQATVISIIDKKTVAVSVARLIKHIKYRKYIKKTKKYLIHCDDSSLVKKDDIVLVVDSRPYSKLKTKVLVKVVEK